MLLFLTNKKLLQKTQLQQQEKVQEALVYVKSSQYGRQYSVTLNHSTWSYPIEVKFQMPTGNDASTDGKFRDTEKIAHILLYGTASSHWSSTADGIGFQTVRADNGSVLSSQGLANYSGPKERFLANNMVTLFIYRVLERLELKLQTVLVTKLCMQ